MSPHQHLLLPAATLLLLLLLSPPTAITAADSTHVLDIDGNPLKADTNYYILPVIRGRGGGLTLLSKNDTAWCPLYVGQEFSEVSTGLPAKFFPVNPDDKLISLYTDLNVVFDAASICVQTTQWQLTNDDAGTGRLLVGTGGVIRNPGLETLSNWFKIDKAGTGRYDYKMVFCPGVCEFCRPICGDLDVFIEQDGRRLLGLTLIRDKYLLVRFKKEA